MADYIDRAALTEQLRTIMTRYFAQGRVDVAKDYNWAITVLDSAPAADVAEVVRCKDCKHKVRIDANGIVICSEEHGMYCPTEKDFCSYGEYQTNTGGNANVSD